MEHIFVSILEMSVSASYLVLAVLAVRFLLKKAPKSMRGFLWLLVGLRLLFPFSIESAFGLIPSTQTANVRIYDMNTQPPAENDGSIMPGMSNRPAVSDVATAPTEIAKNQTSKYLRMCAGIWIAGMAIMAVYMAVSWLGLADRVKTSVPTEFFTSIDGGHSVKIYRSEQIDSPFLFGIVRPHIYIPSHITAEDIPYVILHERAHMKRGDHLIKPAGFLILSVHWFNPFVWAAYIALGRDMELICDELVVRQLGIQCKKQYSQALLASSAGRRMIAACPVAFGETDVKERVKNILDYKKPKFWAITAAGAACVIVPVCFMTQKKADRTPDAPVEIVVEEASSTASESAESEDVLEADKNIIEQEIDKWARAFCSRDGMTISEMADSSVEQTFIDSEMLDKGAGDVSFGWSSPWPWGGGSDVAPNYRIVNISDTSAEILYYAWTSDPHVTVWREIVYFKTENGNCVITSESLNVLDAICTVEEFKWAYPDNVIAGTMMDYYSYNEAGKTLNDNAKANKKLYESLFSPDTAAVYLLNLLQNQNKVETAVRTSATDENECIVSVKFHLSRGEQVDIPMIRPYGTGGIWIPFLPYGIQNITLEPHKTRVPEVDVTVHPYYTGNMDVELKLLN